MVSANDIPPGGEGKITVVLKTKQRCGPNRQRVTVETNDPVSPTIPLEMAADLFFALEALAPHRNLLSIKPIDTVTTTFVFEGELLEQAEIIDVRLAQDVEFPEAFTWQLHDAKTGDTRELSLDVSVNATLIPPSSFKTDIIVTTGFDIPDIELRLTGYILNHIDPEPEHFYMRHLEVTCDMDNVVTFKSNTGIPFKILDAFIEDNEFKLDPWNTEANLEHTLTFHYCPKGPRDRFEARLVIQTDIEQYGQSVAIIHAFQRWPPPTRRPQE